MIDAKAELPSLSELKNSQDLRYISPTEVSDTLSNFGYGPAKMLVTAMYLSEDGKYGVGLLEVTQAMTHDHFNVFRGFDQMEAMGQVYLLMRIFNGDVPEGYRPLLTDVESASFTGTVLAGAMLNLLVEDLSNDEVDFKGRGVVYSGNRPISSASSMSGVIMTTEKYHQVMRIIEKRQQKDQPVFELQDETVVDV